LIGIVTLWLFQRIHRQPLKPSFNFPPSLLPPVLTQVVCKLLGWDATRGVSFCLVVGNALAQLRHSSEPKSKGHYFNHHHEARGEVLVTIFSLDRFLRDTRRPNLTCPR
jgi:hypothetical protein